jgi:hypothetical protein
MSAPMVRALLAGTKTQTRRVAAVDRFEISEHPAGDITWVVSFTKPHGPRRALASYSGGRFTRQQAASIVASQFCPHGKPGDLLWVRETWAECIAVSPATDEPVEVGPGERLIEEPTFWTDERGRKRWHYDGRVIVYRANSSVEFCDGDGFSGEMANRSDMPRWRPSIHMPRWASRLTLEITGVRLERLQEISHADAVAEGALDWAAEQDTPVRDIPSSEAELVYQGLWEELNGGGSWGIETWVWALTFRVHQCNVDRMAAAA